MLRIYSAPVLSDAHGSGGSWHIKVCHFAHDTFDRFHGFSSVPVEL
jgi:hypothetical protein